MGRGPPRETGRGVTALASTFSISFGLIGTGSPKKRILRAAGVGVSKSLLKKARSRASRIQAAARAFVGHWRNERLPVCQNLFESSVPQGGRQFRAAATRSPNGQPAELLRPPILQFIELFDATTPKKKLVGIVCRRRSPQKWTVSVSRPTQPRPCGILFAS